MGSLADSESPAMAELGERAFHRPEMVVMVAVAVMVVCG